MNPPPTPPAAPASDRSAHEPEREPEHAHQAAAPPASGTEAENEVEVYPPRSCSWYVLGILTLAYVFSFIDRQILNLMVGPIRRDLQISDTQMSLLMGFSFAVFYTLFGIPLGRLADVRSRRLIIAVGIAFWSVMTAGCGLARRFWQLALLRMGVGVGEATLSPAAYSLIADSFRPQHRATAISVYSMGIYIGSGLAFILGGLVVGFVSTHEAFVLPVVGAVRPWQAIFLVVGLPGLVMALLACTIREPTRKGLRTDAAGTSARHVPLRAVVAYLVDNRATFLCLNLGIAFLAFTSYGSAAWIPTFFVRHHGWSPGASGVVFGEIVAISGTLGIVAGGRLADWLRQRGHADAELRVAFLAALGWLPFGILFPLVPRASWSAVLLAPSIFCSSAPFGVAPAAIQHMMPNPMRAQASAVYLFVINLIGLGLGPTAVALMTDLVFHNDAAVGLSLVIVGTVAQLVAILLLLLGLAPYRRSLAYRHTPDLHRPCRAANAGGRGPV